MPYYVDCRYWAQGVRCRFGSRCHFSHSSPFGWRVSRKLSVEIHEEEELPEDPFIQMAKELRWEEIKRQLECSPELLLKGESRADGNNVLYYAVEQGRLDVTELLLKVAKTKQLEVLQANKNSGNTILHSAARLGNVEIAKSILRHQGGEDLRSGQDLVNMKNNDGRKPSTLGRVYNQDEAATFLEDLEKSKISFIQQEAITKAQTECSFRIKDIRLMFLGEGRSGKTSTIRSLLNEPFRAESESTVGADVLHLNIQLASEWRKIEYEGDEIPDNEAEAIADKAMEICAGSDFTQPNILPMTLVTDVQKNSPQRVHDRDQKSRKNNARSAKGDHPLHAQHPHVSVGRNANVSQKFQPPELDEGFWRSPAEEERDCKVESKSDGVQAKSWKPDEYPADLTSLKFAALPLQSDLLVEEPRSGVTAGIGERLPQPSDAAVYSASMSIQSFSSNPKSNATVEALCAGPEITEGHVTGDSSDDSVEEQGTNNTHPPAEFRVAIDVTRSKETERESFPPVDSNEAQGFEHQKGTGADCLHPADTKEEQGFHILKGTGQVYGLREGTRPLELPTSTQGYKQTYSSNDGGALTSITAMSCYESCSEEELRAGDYSMSRTRTVSNSAIDGANSFLEAVIAGNFVWSTTQDVSHSIIRKGLDNHNVQPADHKEEQGFDIPKGTGEVRMAKPTEIPTSTAMQGYEKTDYDGGALISITAMSCYESCSEEELRAGDYSMSRTRTVSNSSFEGAKSFLEAVIAGDYAWSRTVTSDSTIEGAKKAMTQYNKEVRKFHIWDYGGQKVFYSLHHLFMTRYGVYFLVFSMSKIISSAGQASLQFLRYWLDSVWAHARDTTRDGITKCARLILIGTSKDKVQSLQEHVRINRLLTDAFESHPAWRYAAEFEVKEHHYDDESYANVSDRLLTFFPLDNKEAIKDLVLPDLRQKIEKIAADANEDEYVDLSVPREWFRALTKFQEMSKDRNSLKFKEEVLPLCRKFGMPSMFFESAVQACRSDAEKLEVEARTMLRFFHQLGRVMYYEEETLRNLVVLDPISFIEPVTRIICRHDTLHQTKESGLLARPDWKLLEQNGVLTRSLMHILWCDRRDHWDELEFLMVKFGLMVPMNSSRCNEECYVVPAIHCHDEDYESTSTEQLIVSQFPELRPGNAMSVTVRTCILFFAETEIFEKWNDEGYVTAEQLRNFGFLPDGIFPRLLCKAVEWSQFTAGECSGTTPQGCLRLDELPPTFSLGSREARIFFGDHKFVLQDVPHLGFIRVNILIDSTYMITKVLQQQASEVLSECIPAVKCGIAIPIDGGLSTYDNNYEGIFVFLSGRSGLLNHVAGRDFNEAKIGSSSDVKKFDLTNKYKNSKTNKAILSWLQSDPLSQCTIMQNDPVIFKLSNLKERFKNWLPPIGLVDKRARQGEICCTDLERVSIDLEIECLYDVFFSYRHGPFDNDLTNACFCQLSNLSVTFLSCQLTRGRKLEVFLDSFRLQEGSDFQDQFADAMLKSEVVVPVISANAFLRLCSLKRDSEIDNVLLEWTILVELLELGLKKYCCPIFIGEIRDIADEQGSFVQDLFSQTGPNGETIVDRLPDVPCEKIIKKVEKLFSRWKGKYSELPSPTQHLSNRTVKDTVRFLLNIMTSCTYQGFPKAFEHDKKIEEQPDHQKLTSNHLKESFRRNLFNFCSGRILNLVETAAASKELYKQERISKANENEQAKIRALLLKAEAEKSCLEAEQEKMKVEHELFVKAQEERARAEMEVARANSEKERIAAEERNIQLVEELVRKNLEERAGLQAEKDKMKLEHDLLVKEQEKKVKADLEEARAKEELAAASAQSLKRTPNIVESSCCALC